MKSGLRILGLLVLLVSAFKLSAQYNYELKTTEDMMLLFDQSPDQMHKTVVVFEEQLDIEKYERMFKQLKTSSDDRKVIVATELREIASRSQEAILPKIIAITGLDESQIEAFWVFNGVELYLNAETARAIAELPEVMAIEHIPVMEKYDSEVAAVSAPAPNGHEHAHDVIKATALWAMGYTGYGITSYTIDTGVNPKHASLSANFKGNIAGNEVDAWYQGSQGELPYECDEEDSHGTHVTGTILGLDRLTNDTIGAAFNANWIGAATVACPSGSSMAAMQFALDPDGNTSTADAPDVINNSWGQGPGDCNTLSWQFTLNNVYSAGIANIWAAGNYGPGSETVGSPAQFIYNELNSFSVGNLNGHNQNYNIASSSSRGPSICPGSATLKIKPEVSAPGYNIRSAVGSEGYAEYVGTSMAAPQVAGGICLLKEAFPLVSGVEITEAIYYTAIDLGDPGEDNTFGNGLIDLMEAYDYLIDQGHIPSDPSYDNDIVIHNMKSTPFNCTYGVSTSFYVQNTGAETVTSFDYTLEFNGLSVTESWEGSLASGDNVLIEPEIMYPDAGAGYIRATVNLTSATDDRALNNSMVNYIEVIDEGVVDAFVLGDNDCLGANQSAWVEADLGISYDVIWYNDFLGTDQYGSGNPLNVEIDESTTLYAQPRYSTNVGDPRVEQSVSTDSPINKGLIFNAYQEFLLKSVKVNALGPGFFNVVLEDASGSVLGSKIAPLQLGVQEIDLNFNVPAGNGLRLKLKGNTDLGVLDEDVNFPYVLDGVVNIYKSLAQALTDQLTKYHYFFDWEICFSSVCQPFPVEFEYGGSEGPAASFEASSYELDLQEGGQVDFTQTVDAGASFEWDFGNGQTSTEENPSITYTQEGTYIVTLEATDGDCSSVYSKAIVVKNITTSANRVENDLDVLVYPNPVQDGKLYIESGDLEMTGLRLYNLSGMLIFDKKLSGLNNYRIDQQNNPPGVYFLQINTNKGLIVKKITF